MTIEAEVSAIMLDAGWSTSVCRKGEALSFARREGAYWIINGRPNGVDDHVGVAGPGAEFADPIPLAYALVDRAKVVQREQAQLVATAALSVVPPVAEPVAAEPVPDPRDEALAAAEAELAALRARIAELEQPEPEAPLLPAPDALMSDYGPVDPKDAETIIDGFAGELRTSRDTAEGTMRSMDPPDRRRLFSILNTELGRLKNQEALLGKSIPRRADVEELIGILAKVGEA